MLPKRRIICRRFELSRSRPPIETTGGDLIGGENLEGGDHGVSGASAAPGLHLVHLVGVAGEEGLDGAVAAVADPAVEAQEAGVVDGPVAVEHALHPPLHHNPNLRK